MSQSWMLANYVSGREIKWVIIDKLMKYKLKWTAYTTYTFTSEKINPIFDMKLSNFWHEIDQSCFGKNRIIFLKALREAPRKDTACLNDILPNSISTPPPPAKWRFVVGIFHQKLANSLKQRFWLWEWTFWQQLWSNMILRWYSDVNHGR